MKTTLRVFGIVVLVWTGAHAGLETIARYAERHLDVYLWKTQDYLRLLTPTYQVDRGRGRLFIYGASEAREDLLAEEIGRVATAWKPYQGSMHSAVLDETLVVLEYLERAYGATAMPEALLLGITSRFIADIRREPSPLYGGIDKYSPDFKVLEDRGRPRLVEKTAIEGLLARAAILNLQPDRYRRAAFAIVNHVLGPSVPALARYEARLTRPGKYINTRLAPEHMLRAWLVDPESQWAPVHAWDPNLARDQVTASLRRLREYTNRHDIQLFVVNLPETSWNRVLYKEGRYEAYLASVRAALPGVPFLDLRSFVPDEEFYDETHTTWRGGIRVSTAVGDFLMAHTHKPSRAAAIGAPLSDR